MKNLTFFILFSLSFFTVAFAQDQADVIYNGEVPDVINVWNRVADFSPNLRAVEAGELSPDGRLAVSGAKFGYALMLWRVVDGTLLWENKHESEIECVTFSPDGNRIASGGEDYFLVVWETATGKELHRMNHPRGLDGIAWSNNGKIIAAGTESGEVFLWDADTYQLIGKVKVGSSVNSLQFTKDDERIVVGGNIKHEVKPKEPFAKLLDVATLETLREYKGGDVSTKSIRVSTNEKWVATGYAGNKANLFDLESGELIKIFEEPFYIEAVAFTPDNQYLITGGHDKKIRFYRMKDYEMVYTVRTPRTEYIDISDDGRLMLTSHEDSGMLSLFMFLSGVPDNQDVYHKLSKEQLDNKDMKEQ